MNYAPGGMFGGMYGQMPMTSAGGWNFANSGGYAGMPSQSAMNSDAMMRQNFMGIGMDRLGGWGMFGGFQGGQQGGDLLGNHAWKGGQQSGGFDTGTWYGGRSYQEANGARGPQMSTGYTVNEQMPQTGGAFNPMVGSSMGATPQMSKPYQVAQQQAPVQQSRPQQSFEDFASTLSGSGMTSGQMNDLYQAQIAKASAPTNFWQNVGPGGTQNPFPQSPQPFPQNWGNQTFGFDPKSLAGQRVTPDKAWFFGQDSVNRMINNQGNAVPTFRSPADGFQRTRPWFGGM